ncbi:hypothetical protein Droror1_Dr00003990 [Drosera rotundifolia]
MPPSTRRRNTALRRLAAAAVYIVIGHFCSAVLSAPSLIGVHPLDEKYFDSELIKCKDGSKWFSRDRINDDFCDCVDGTDEPGTSACPRGRFYCRNVGSRPQFLFSSRVNDNICDCCDGSDEYDSSVNCPNACVMGGNLEYKPLIHRPTINHLSSINIKGRQLGGKYDEWIQNLKGLKLFAIFQLVIMGLVLVFRLFGRHFKSRRRRHRLRDLP